MSGPRPLNVGTEVHGRAGLGDTASVELSHPVQYARQTLIHNMRIALSSSTVRMRGCCYRPSMLRNQLHDWKPVLVATVALSCRVRGGRSRRGFAAMPGDAGRLPRPRNQAAPEQAADHID